MHMHAKILTSKNHRDLKNDFFKFANNFLLLQRTIVKNKIQIFFIYLFLGPKNGKTNFFTWSKEKPNCLSISSFLTFKQTKEQILFQAQPLKMLNTKFVCPL